MRKIRFKQSMTLQVIIDYRRDEGGKFEPIVETRTYEAGRQIEADLELVLNAPGLTDLHIEEGAVIPNVPNTAFELVEPNPDSEVVTLDGMWPDDLSAYAKKHEHSSDPTTMLLVEYARNKARAMRLRAVGRIAEAIKLEETCDGIYDKLPEKAKW